MKASEVFGIKKPIIGMVHSLPLPGTPRGKDYSIEQVYDYGVDEAAILKEAGVDAIMIENAGDIPFVKSEYLGPDTAAFIAVLGQHIRETTALPVGINIVANAVMHSIAAAKACGGTFVRSNQWANAYIANEGFVEGASGLALRYRDLLGANEIKILADVHVKHGSHAIVQDRPIAEQAADVEMFDADVLIATGFRTGHATAPEEVAAIKAGATLDVLVGSGISAENCSTLLSVADGAIVGVSVKNPRRMSGKTDPDKIKRFMDAVYQIREQSGVTGNETQ